MCFRSTVISYKMCGGNWIVVMGLLAVRRHIAHTGLSWHYRWNLRFSGVKQPRHEGPVRVRWHLFTQSFPHRVTTMLNHKLLQYIQLATLLSECVLNAQA